MSIAEKSRLLMPVKPWTSQIIILTEKSVEVAISSANDLKLDFREPTRAINAT